MTVAECQVETMNHIEKVRYYLRKFTAALTTRGVKHDKTKLETPEVEVFAEYTPKLAQTEYGSGEYYAYLDEMMPALTHHYANNRHHPEHFEYGISEMNLIDLVEMMADWKAASQRQHDVNLLLSIKASCERFDCDEQLTQILINTARIMDEWDAQETRHALWTSGMLKKKFKKFLIDTKKFL